MVSSEGVTIVPIADAAWPDVQQVFGTRGDPARCWCQFFKLTNQQWWDGSTEEKEALLHEQAGESRPGDGVSHDRNIHWSSTISGPH